MSSIRQILDQLKGLAEDVESQPFIVRDNGCLPGLSLFLQNEDTDVILSTLELLAILGSHPENKSIMSECNSLMVNLSSLGNSHSNSAVRQGSRNVLEIISRRTSPRKRAVPPPAQDEKHDGVLDNSMANTVTSGAESGLMMNMLQNSNKRYAMTVVLYIPCMTTEYLRKRVEGVLLDVAGIISFVLDMKLRKATIRSSNGAHLILAALKKAGITANTVVSKPGDDTIMMSAAEKVEPVIKENKTNDEPAPGYLDAPTTAASKREKRKNSRALAVIDTVDGRVDADRKTKAGGWLGTITNLFW